MFDLPDPLGPPMTLTPGSNSRAVGSANDLKPDSLRARTNTGSTYRCRGTNRRLFLFARVTATMPPAPNRLMGLRTDYLTLKVFSFLGGSRSTWTFATRAPFGPARHSPTTR